jgi:hypothetical protein
MDDLDAALATQQGSALYPATPMDEVPGSEPSVPTPPPPGEAALIAELSAKVEAPTFLRNAFREMTADRKYVAEDAMLRNTSDAVAVNMIFRNQIVSLAYLGVSDPQPLVQPARRVGGVTDPITERFAETMEIHLSHEAKVMDLGRQVEGAAQDASTNGFAILKVTLQADYTKDATGGPRFADMQESALEYLRLKTLNPDPDSADGRRLADAEQTVRLAAANILADQIQAQPVLVMGEVPRVDPITGAAVLDPYTGMPVMDQGLVPDPTDAREKQRKAIINGEEFDLLSIPAVEHHLGFKVSQVQPDDFRWEWGCTRPEDLPYAEWQADRRPMTVEQIQREWKLTKEEVARIAPKGNGARVSGPGTGSADVNPSERTETEVSMVNDTIMVWEAYHRPTFRRYVFIPGMDRFLENEQVQNAGSRFFPYFMVYYNRATGYMLPISDVALTRHLQDEINQLRSHGREARRASYPVLFVPKGWLDAKALNLYRNRVPFSVIEVENAEAAKEAMKESVTVTYNAALFDTSQAEAQMQAMFGIPQIVVGGAGQEDLASAVALSKEAMETGVARRRIQMNRVITDIFLYMAEVSLKVFSSTIMKMRYGPAAEWPKLSPEQLYTQLHIEVKGGMSGQPRAKDRMDLWMNFAQILRTLNLPANGIEILKQLLDAMGIRIDVSRFIMPTAAVPMAPNPSAEEPSRGQGPDGGAPHMVDPARGAPSSIEEVPNHPPL